MTPGARVATTIQILEKIEQSYLPANRAISSFYRSRRFIGSKDRHEISSKIYNILRHHARLLWWTNDGSSRLRTIASMALLDGLSETEILNLFDGIGYAPQPLSPSELKLLKKAKDQSIDNAAMPDWVTVEVPKWLFVELKSHWALELKKETAALNQPAPLDLRVNTLKATFAGALAILKNDGIEAQPTPYSPICLRIENRVNLSRAAAFKEGFVEIQDEGSQLIALLVDAKADQITIDFCAGGGGKTLALAAEIKNEGPIIACEVNPHRLNKMTRRLKRAGASNITLRKLSGLDDPWIEASARSASRVLLDVPCSGSGVWRRSPAAKWRLTADELATHLENQACILTAAAKLVATGGRLIYATCSVLPKENEGQIERFLERNSNFDVFPISLVWATVFGSECPSPDPFLSLTPARQGTDGFFCAVLKRKQ